MAESHTSTPLRQYSCRPEMGSLPDIDSRQLRVFQLKPQIHSTAILREVSWSKFNWLESELLAAAYRTRVMSGGSARRKRLYASASSTDRLTMPRASVGWCELMEVNRNK